MKRAVVVLAAALVIGLAFTQLLPSLLSKSNSATSPEIKFPLEENPVNESSGASNDDAAFTSWFWETGKAIKDIVDEGKAAGQNMDAVGAESSAIRMQNVTSEYLAKISDFNLSAAFQDVRDEYKIALSDFQEAGYYVERGANNLNPDDVYTGIDFMESASQHLDNATIMLNNLS